MTSQPPPELFAPQRPMQSAVVHAPSYKLRRFMTSLIAAALLVGGAYAIYLWKRAPMEIPTIHADAQLKQKPEQPGGIDIPNQDVMAYQQIDSSEAPKPSAEHLAAPPETPQPVQMSNAAPMPTPDKGTQGIESLATTPPPTVIPTTVSPPAPAPANAAKMAAVDDAEKSSPAPTVAAPSAPQVTPPASPAVAAPAPAADNTAAASKTVNNISTQAKPPATTSTSTVTVGNASGKKGFRIQLASFPDQNEAEHEMGRMQEKFAGQLGAAKLHLARADLGSRGIYYRVQSDTITDSEAHDICAALKNLKAGCIIVKP